ncbi:hypothetical protein SETIT_4G071700v2 [Setaria italica]|uniref:Uncharacterized protein n=1 Tax=Setaria italica TaxID=4555 RepID=A0A368QRN9_SETIT|nr:hypothetical protein SETIT_4G071700v2 [Setaria italica]
MNSRWCFLSYLLNCSRIITFSYWDAVTVKCYCSENKNSFKPLSLPTFDP